MQGKPARKLRQFCSIEKIPRDRTADGAHMHADLVGAARFQTESNQGTAMPAFQHLVMGYGGLAVLPDASQEAGGLDLGNGRGDGSGGGRRHALSDGEIAAPEVRRVQKRLQPMLGMGRFGDDHQAAGALVQAIHRTVDKTCWASGMGKERVFQGIIRVPRAGLAGQGRGLVDHIEVFVLVGNGQGQRVGAKLIRGHLMRPQHGDGLPLADKAVHPGGLAVQQDALIPLGGFHGGIAHAHDLTEDIPQAAAGFALCNLMFHEIPPWIIVYARWG